MIRFVERPDFNDPEKMLKWFCDVFGLSSGGNDTIEEQILRNFTVAAPTEQGPGKLGAEARTQTLPEAR